MKGFANNQPRQLALGLLLWAFSGLSPGLIAQDREHGVYPTLEEATTLSSEYRREIGGVNTRERTFGEPGLYSYPQPYGYSDPWGGSDPYGHQMAWDDPRLLFNSFDTTMSFFTGRGIRFYDGYYYGGQHLYADAGAGFLPFTTGFNPDTADFKAGPFYLDLRSITGTVLYTDYSGSDVVADDGWLGVISTQINMAAQLSPRFFFTLSAMPYYIPTTNEFGLSWGGAGGGKNFARVGYEAMVGNWSIFLYDEFSGILPYSLIFDDLAIPAYDRVGRYAYGFLDYPDRPTVEFDSDNIFFRNQVGISASGPISPDTRGSLNFTHSDGWLGTSFDDHTRWDNFNAKVNYLGWDWIAPYAGYSLSAHDDWDSLYHRVYVGAHSWITEALTVSAQAGYLFSSGVGPDYDSPLGSATITHWLTPYTWHALSGGIQFVDTDLGSEYLSEYVRYSIGTQLGFRTSVGAFVGYGEHDRLDDALGEFSGVTAGLSATTALTELTQIGFYAGYNDRDYSDLAGIDRTQWIYRARLTHRFNPFLYGAFIYQYEDSRSTFGFNYNEHLYRLSLTYQF